MEVYAADGSWTADCVVKLDGDQIRIEYNEEDSGGILRSYRGYVDEEGHYRLECPEVRGHGKLQKFFDDQILIGDWIEGQDEGLWKIIIAE